MSESIPTLEQVVNQWRTGSTVEAAALDDITVNQLLDALTAREDTIADTLRVAGVQYGLFSEIVAEVLADVGLGHPVDEAQRLFIRRQYVALMQRLEQEFRNQQ